MNRAAPDADSGLGQLVPRASTMKSRNMGAFVPDRRVNDICRTL